MGIVRETLEELVDAQDDLDFMCSQASQYSPDRRAQARRRLALAWEAARKVSTDELRPGTREPSKGEF
jgi:hypothetical protein